MFSAALATLLLRVGSWWWVEQQGHVSAGLRHRLERARLSHRVDFLSKQASDNFFLEVLGVVGQLIELGRVEEVRAARRVQAGVAGIEQDVHRLTATHGHGVGLVVEVVGRQVAQQTCVVGDHRHRYAQRGQGVEVGDVQFGNAQQRLAAHRHIDLGRQRLRRPEATIGTHRGLRPVGHGGRRCNAHGRALQQVVVDAGGDGDRVAAAIQQEVLVLPVGKRFGVEGHADVVEVRVEAHHLDRVGQVVGRGAVAVVVGVAPGVTAMIGERIAPTGWRRRKPRPPRRLSPMLAACPKVFARGNGSMG
jgi:hypothetical protein